MIRKVAPNGSSGIHPCSGSAETRQKSVIRRVRCVPLLRLYRISNAPLRSDPLEELRSRNPRTGIGGRIKLFGSALFASCTCNALSSWNVNSYPPISTNQIPSSSHARNTRRYFTRLFEPNQGGSRGCGGREDCTGWGQRESGLCSSTSIRRARRDRH